MQLLKSPIIWVRLFASKTKPNASQRRKDACLANTLRARLGGSSVQHLQQFHSWSDVMFKKPRRNGIMEMLEFGGPLRKLLGLIHLKEYFLWGQGCQDMELNFRSDHMKCTWGIRQNLIRKGLFSIQKIACQAILSKNPNYALTVTWNVSVFQWYH